MTARHALEIVLARTERSRVKEPDSPWMKGFNQGLESAQRNVRDLMRELEKES